MKARRLNFAYVFAALLAVAVTVSGNARAGDKKNNSAYALIAMDGMAVDKSTSYTYTFRQVDVESGKFLRKSFSISFSSLGWGENEIAKPEALQTTMRFGGKSVLAGDYAFVSTTTRSRFGSRRYDDIKCFSLGTIVYRFRESQTNLALLGDAQGRSSRIDPAKLASDVAAVLAESPKLSAPAVSADVVGKIKFTDADGQGRGSCMSPKTFTFSLIGG